MALFRRKAAESASTALPEARHPLVSRMVHCSVCGSEQKFSRCWHRVGYVRTCTGCGMAFEDPSQIYRQVQPGCPQCAEPLEQPGFDYGCCDACGSKFEIMEGTKPGLLPNRAQRDAMDRHGKARRVL